MSINERVRDLRKHLHLTQVEFGERITVAQSYLTSIENGKRDVTEKILKLICHEFNVNEDWLRYGQGEMFIENDSTILSSLVSEYNLDPIDKEIIEGYLALNSEQRKAIKNYVRSIANAIIMHDEIAVAKDEDDDIERELESYRLELEAEKRGKMSSVSRDSEEKKKNESLA